MMHPKSHALRGGPACLSRRPALRTPSFPSPFLRLSILHVTRTRIKICGITNPADALAAARAGADAIGIVLHDPAPRYVSLEQASEILAVLPPFVTPVGLFVDADAPRVLNTARALGLRHVQLHGNETPQTVAALHGLAVIKAMRVDADFAATLATWRDAIQSLELTMLRGIVLETAGSAGGTGVPNDWAAVKRHEDAGAFEGLPPIIAAGGLRPETVADVVRIIRPWAVDVSSGVEEEPRKKSPRLIAAFVEAVRGADQEK